MWKLRPRKGQIIFWESYSQWDGKRSWMQGWWLHSPRQLWIHSWASYPAQDFPSGSAQGNSSFLRHPLCLTCRISEHWPILVITHSRVPARTFSFSSSGQTKVNILGKRLPPDLSLLWFYRGFFFLVWSLVIVRANVEASNREAIETKASAKSEIAQLQVIRMLRRVCLFYFLGGPHPLPATSQTLPKSFLSLLLPSPVSGCQV